MKNIRHYSTALVIASFLTLTACGSISGLTKESSDAPARIADFTRVEVLDFTASDQEHYQDAGKQASFDADIKEAQRVFADKIA